MAPLSESTRRNVVEYLIIRYKLGTMGPDGGIPKIYSKVGHHMLFTKGLQFWKPHVDETASCCLAHKNTRGNPRSLFKHCATRSHLTRLVQEKPSSLIKKLKYYLIPINAFDISKAPTLINHSHKPVRDAAIGTLKGSYKLIPP